MKKQEQKKNECLEVALPSALTIALGKCNGQCTRQRKIFKK
jgi:hypothetical protein